jgi:hypothetical protein
MEDGEVSDELNEVDEDRTEMTVEQLVEANLNSDLNK